MSHYVIPLDQLTMQDVHRVGGKNASLGEMLQNLSPLGVAVPGGFATTAAAYQEFLAQADVAQKINARLRHLNVEVVAELQAAGAEIRSWIMALPFPQAMETAIDAAYATLVAAYGESVSWAVRSSATAEDLPDASFAGQQETFLNVSGLSMVKKAIYQVFASLFNDRAIAYRVHQSFDHQGVYLSAAVQKMVRSDLASAGVAFTLDTESGFSEVVFITGSFGLGEMVVQGAVNPDEFYLYKPNVSAQRPAILRRTLGKKLSKMIYAADARAAVQTVDISSEDRLRFCLNDSELNTLARMAITIEQHYGRPMDIEWAKDGLDGQIYIVQARPETVQSRQVTNKIEKYLLKEKGKVLATGRAIGNKIGAGKVRLCKDLESMQDFDAGDILLSDMTDPDWEPIMKKAAAIITNRGGRTCHAAIIARELGVPAVVGCGDATETIREGSLVTVSCAEGDEGYIYQGQLSFVKQVHTLDALPNIPTKIMMNVGNPDRAFHFSRLPNAGVGLARLEFIVNSLVGIHPKALIHFDKMDASIQKLIQEKTAAYADPVTYFVQRLSEGVATIAAAFYPKPVIVRLSDFKSNEYANLLGGQTFEPHEENPMLGYRGAARYLSKGFQDCFALECRAIKYVRENMSFHNIEVMIPFVRTTKEAEGVLNLLKANDLERGRQGLRVIMMCELPANALLAEEFLAHFDGFSIGSNDMTQLTLGLDRDSALVAESFDERNPAVLKMLSMAITACKKTGKYIGICGQGPSDHPELAIWLLEQGIQTMSLNPDTVVDTWLRLAGVVDS